MPPTPRRRQGEKPKGPRPTSVEVSDVYTEEELTVLFEMMIASGHVSMQQVIRVALWRHAQHLEVECSHKLFATGRR